MSSSYNNSTQDPRNQTTQWPEKSSATKKPITPQVDQEWKIAAGFDLSNYNPYETKAANSGYSATENRTTASSAEKRPKIQRALETKKPSRSSSTISPMSMDMQSLLGLSTPAKTEPMGKGQILPPNQTSKKGVVPMSFDMGLLGSLKDQATQITNLPGDILHGLGSNIVTAPPVSLEKQMELADKKRRDIEVIAPQIRRMRIKQVATISQVAERARTNPDQQKYQAFRSKIGSVLRKVLKHRDANQDESRGKDEYFMQTVLLYKEEQVYKALGKVNPSGKATGNRQNANLKDANKEIGPGNRGGGGAG